MIKQIYKQSQAGQTLLEIILAFGVSILVLSAVMIGITTSLNNTQYTKNQGLANSYAQEAMAVVRKIRDSNWPYFYSKNGDYCLAQGETELEDNESDCAQNGIVGGIFARSVKLERDSLDCSAGIPPAPIPTPTLIPKGTKVTVRVSWSDGKCPTGVFCHKVELVNCFSKID